ncbi:hypothetical protein F8388_019709, partial (mitochondrion) [Cannabis sativa]
WGSGMRSYGKEYITASLIREFLMIVVFCMLDPLLFYVLPESVLIPMLCGAEHLLFAGIKLFLCRGLVLLPARPLSLILRKSLSLIAVIGGFRKDLIVDRDFNLCGGRGGCPGSLGSTLLLLRIIIGRRRCVVISGSGRSLRWVLRLRLDKEVFEWVGGRGYARTTWARWG